MDKAKLQADFENLLRKNLKYDEITSDDWNRIDFSRYTVPELNRCVEDLKLFSKQFTKMNQPELNKQTVDLMYAMQFDIRGRLLSDQYPELYQPLLEANKTIQETSDITKRTSENIDKLWEILKKQDYAIEEVKGWQRHYDGHLEPLFTDIVLEYLRSNSPINEIINVFQMEYVTPSKKWNYPPHFNFEVDGLVYDQTVNVLYMVESKFHLTLKELAKAVETWNQLADFVRSEKLPNVDSNANFFNRLWNLFFNGEDALIQNKDLTVVKSFLGFHSVESEAILDEARKHGFKLIGPDGNHYHVYE